MKKTKILILGSSCWVAHYLIKDLLANDFEVIGISNKNTPKHNIENYLIDMNSSQYFDQIKNSKAQIILNMIHSPDYERSFQLHKQIVEYTNNKNIFYVYMSSSNACDATLGRASLENDKACASSEYGKYKAKCENYLLNKLKNKAINTNLDFCIIRFPATHGYAPNRLSRTEEFLAKLQKREKIKLPTGIIQNRPYTGHLSSMISRLIQDKQTGIFHLGTYDESDEKDFLIRVARAFGYTTENFKLGNTYEHHMSVTPQRIYELYGSKYRFSEEETIQALLKDPALTKYK